MMKSIVALVALILLVQANSDGLTVNPVCSLCHEIVGLYQHSIPRKPTEIALDLIGTAYCTKKKLQHHNVCKGAVH